MYVQDKMREDPPNFGHGLKAHISIYAAMPSALAADVDATLIQICADHGKMEHATTAKALT